MQINGAAQVRLLWAINQQLAVNVLGAIVSGNPTFGGALANTLGSAIKAAFTSQLQSHMGTSTSLVRIGVRDLRTDNQPEFFDTGAAVTGNAVGDNLPGSVALCVTLRTNQSGKSFRGRTYLSGWAELENTAQGNQSTAAGTAALAFMQAVDSAMASALLPMAVLTRPSPQIQIIKRTFLDDGSFNDEIKTTIKRKAGNATDVLQFENRIATWETQRRRVNARGATPALLQVGQTLPTLRAE